SLKASNGAWLSLSESTLRLKPGETRTLQVHMHIPEDSSAFRLSHSMLFFTQVKEQEASRENRGLGIRVLLEMGIQIYQVPIGLAPADPEFLAFEDRGLVHEKTDTLRRIAIKIKNSGSKNLDANLRFELTDKTSGSEI